MVTVPSGSEEAFTLALRGLFTIERYGLEATACCACLDCHRPVMLKLLCADCAERRRREDQMAHGHYDACYQPEAPTDALCVRCRDALLDTSADASTIP